MPSGNSSSPVCIEPIMMRLGRLTNPRSRGWKRCGYACMESPGRGEADRRRPASCQPGVYCLRLHEAVELHLDDGIAFADRVFQPCPVEHLDAAAAVADEPGALKRPGSLRH